ncbi:MAG: T9SS type A sorting domain-containing protein [Opitutaceae bacterium]|nr:T9SS type A sorting domain-containing protein [Cytophagales bacterium]
MKIYSIYYLLLALFLSSINAFAQQTLKVNLSNAIRPVTHCASGSLYGITEALPADVANLIAPLKPFVFTQPALSGAGHQQGVAAAAIPISAKIASTTGKVMIRLPDILTGWPYNWPGLTSYLNSVTTVINSKKASGRNNYYGYEIWNEPDGTWQAANGDFHSVCWKPTFDKIKSLDPTAKIIGPSYSYYNSSSMKAFLTYCKNNNCLPDIICWHQWGAASLSSTIDSYRALEISLGFSPRAISINEYSSKLSDPYEGCPGYSVPFIAKFERKMVESACISWWFTGLPGRLGSLLTANNQKGGGWHLYKWYGDMTGNMMGVTPPNDNSDGIDGFANLDQTAIYASVCLGGNYTGMVNVAISGIPAFFGTKVVAKLEYVPWADKDTPVSGTTAISTTTYTIANGTITVPVNVTNKFYAYRIYLTPATITGLEESEIIDDYVSPNPFNNEGLKISYKGKFQYQITDLKGAVLEEGEGQDEYTAGANLNSGNYLLSVQDRKGKHVKKILKQ